MIACVLCRSIAKDAHACMRPFLVWRRMGRNILVLGMGQAAYMPHYCVRCLMQEIA